MKDITIKEFKEKIKDIPDNYILSIIVGNTVANPESMKSRFFKGDGNDMIAILTFEEPKKGV